jgi:hypothetical protein
LQLDSGRWLHGNQYDQHNHPVRQAFQPAPSSAKNRGKSSAKNRGKLEIQETVDQLARIAERVANLPETVPLKDSPKLEIRKPLTNSTVLWRKPLCPSATQIGGSRNRSPTRPQPLPQTRVD